MDKYTATEMAYKHGYEKGYDNAISEIVRCGECVPGGVCWIQWRIMQVAPEGSTVDEYYCSLGVRKSNFSNQTLDVTTRTA